jgi:hypothetical protein
MVGCFARIKQLTELSGLRVEGCEVTPLMAIATPASERKVIYISRAPVLLRYYVIDPVREEGDLGREHTVLATITRVLDDLTT